MSKNMRYDHSGMRCIDAIRAALTDEEFRGFVKGNVLKYVWRERDKGADADLYKAEDYLCDLRTGSFVEEWERQVAEEYAEGVETDRQHHDIIDAILGRQAVVRQAKERLAEQGVEEP